MIKSILLSVDGSTYTDAQVKYTTQLAKAFESTIKVLTIVDIRVFEWAVAMGSDGFVPVIPSTVYREETKKILESKADAVLEKCAKIFTKEKIQFTTEKLHGPPSDIINEKSHLVDLLVIGARGEYAKWKSKLVGATMDAVARQCNKPIFISIQSFREIANILVAYDGSDKANRALQLAAYFATKLDVGIKVLTVHDNKRLRKKFLDEAATYLDSYSVTVESLGTSGNPEKEIIQAAEENNCGIIVIGASGHSRIREAILGSTTEHVIRNTKIPVLLYK